MRSVDEQLERILGAAIKPAPVRVAISEAQGMLCAEEVVAQRALPGFDQAAVDGYAVRSVDVTEVPVTLPVVGEIAADLQRDHGVDLSAAGERDLQAAGRPTRGRAEVPCVGRRNRSVGGRRDTPPRLAPRRPTTRPGRRR